MKKCGLTEEQRKAYNEYVRNHRDEWISIIKEYEATIKHIKKYLKEKNRN